MRRQPFILLSFSSSKKARKEQETQSYQRFHASVIRTSRVSQTPPQTPPPYFYQWVSHGKNALGAIVYKWPTFAFTSESGYTLGFRRKIAHKGTHGETGGVLGGGWYHYPRSVPHVSETLRGRVSERRTLPLLGLGRGCSQRTQRAFGTAMRLCASLFRGVAAPLGCVVFSVSVEIAACIPCAQGLSACARQGGYHHSRRALHVVETPDGRLSKRLICYFLGLTDSSLIGTK